MTNAGPPPVQNRAIVVAEQNYQQVSETLRANGSAESKAIQAMLGGDKQLRDRFLASAMSMLARSPEILRDATPISIVHAIKESARLGLEPLTEEAAIVVYDHQATLMPMWRGYVKRIRNSGEVEDFDCQLVYTGDDFEWSAGTDAYIRHKPALENRGDYWGVYAFAIMKSGRVIPEVMTVADINAVRDQFGNRKSRSGRPLPWETSWGEMARKTVIRRLAKRLPGAAVKQLLEADAHVDKMLTPAVAVDEKIAEVRQLALQAVGALPEPADPPASVDEPADREEDVASPQETPDPGADPNVAAAMAHASEEEQLRRYRGR